MPGKNADLETQLLVGLVTKVKNLNISPTLEWGKTIELRCPCGQSILLRTPVIPSLKDRQRGLLKSRIREHLHSVHGISDTTIRYAISEAFPN
jgi:hypothetical protein